MNIVDQNKKMEETSAQLEAALQYAGLGLPVVFLKAQSKEPWYTNWQNQANTDQLMLRGTWQGNDLEGNVGVQMGRGKCPIIDIECDDEDAEKEYQALWNGKTPKVPTFKGSRGKHRLFKWRKGLPNKAYYHAGKIEIRIGNGGGAQSVFPPSVHPTGAVYAWEPGLSIFDVEPGDIPDEILQKLVALDKSKSTASGGTESVDHEEAIQGVALSIADRKKQAQKWLTAHPGMQAGSGNGCDQKVTWLAIQLLWGFALPADIAVDLLAEWGARSDQIDAHGLPYPWSRYEMERKVNWALSSHYENKIGDRLYATAVDTAGLEQAMAAAPKDQFAEITAAIKKEIKEEKPKQSKPKLTQAQQLIAIGETAELWKTPDMVPYATFGEHRENWSVRSSIYRGWLVEKYWEQYGTTASERAIKSALEILERKALKGSTYQLHLRIARVEDTIYWDLSNERWECLEIKPDGWKVIDNPPVKFWRNKETAPLPYPVAGGSLEELRPLVRPDDEYWVLIQGAMLDYLKGHGPYCVLAISGEQGSAKSTLARFIKQTIDPVFHAPLAALPQKEHDLGVDGQNELVLAYDNVSHLTPWMSDALCRLATGAGIKTRKLYTDNEQNVFGLCRPVMMNGIPDFADRPDLISRCIVVYQPTIPETERLTEKDLTARFNQIHPRLVGALAKLVSDGLRRIPSTKLERLPRMADSATWATACMGNTAFLDRFTEGEHEAEEASLQASNTATTLRAFFAGRDTLDIAPADLLYKLRKTASDLGMLANLPADATRLSNKLRRDAPAMRKQWGLDVQSIKSNGKRVIRITRLGGEQQGR
jgi:hypothetical protein